MNKLIHKAVTYFKNLSTISKVAVITVLILGLLGLLLQILFPDRPPIVAEINPSIEFGIPENSNFSVSFTQVLDMETQKNVSFKVEPTISAETFWLRDNYQYYIQVTENLKLDTEYTVTVLYKNKEIASKTYLTSPFTLEEQRQHIIEQSQADIEFNEAIENLKKDFPWYSNIPIDTDQFTIVYDYDRKQFRIRLKVPENTSAEIIDNLTKKALSALQDIDVNPTEWGYYVLFLN